MKNPTFIDSPRCDDSRGGTQRKKSVNPARGARLVMACFLTVLSLATVPLAEASMLGLIEVQRDGVGGVEGLIGAEAVAMSPDGAHIYAGGTTDNALAVFSRDSSTGALTFVQAVFDGAGGVVDGLAKVQGVAVSPDGAHVYAAAYTDDAVAVFARNVATGALTFVERQRNGYGGITTMNGAYGVTVSPDGAHVYVASVLSNSVTVFSRNAATGALMLVEAHVDGAGGITSLAGAETVVTSPDGAHVYVAAQGDNAVTAFSRDAATGRLTFIEFQKEGTGGVDGLAGVQGVTVSSDGAQVYTASHDDGAVAVFGRNATTGRLTFVEVHKDGVNGVDGLGSAEWVTASPNGAYVYGVSDSESSIVVFRRNATTGALTFVELYREGIGGIDGLDGASEVVVSPDSVYVYAVAKLDNSVAAFGSLCGNGVFDDGEDCDDGNVIDGDCCSSICTSEPAGAACGDDGNVCTDDKCNGVGLCLHVDNTAACDDGNFCTVNDICASRVCVGATRNCSGAGDQCNDGVCDEMADVCVPQPKADGVSCDDGDACTQSDSCLAGACVGADPVICTALDQCHVAGECDPATGACSDPEKTDGAPCDDGDGCTQTDSCLAGICVGADPVMCTALDQCHVAGECDPATGVCSNPEAPEDTPCDDGDLCTRLDTCEEGVCGGADPVFCTALDQCHVAGVCDPATGLCSDPAKADGTPCDDATACTRIDTCVAGSCVGSDPVMCTALDQCHVAGECDPATGVCSDPAKADGAPCDDGDSCTQSDTCAAGSCVGSDPVMCTALDQCHVAGECDPATGLCSNPEVADGTACDDGDSCTQSDTCAAGSCVGADPVMCAALDQCHVAGECDPATGVCSDPAKADGTPCDDASACTRVDACAAGSCVGADPVICMAADQCHQAGQCDPATGQCSNPAKADGAPCDDGDGCTQTDSCVEGVCVGVDPVMCTALDQCHVAGECDPATGLCSNPEATNGTVCDDGDSCTQIDSCLAGVCVGVDPVICTALDQCHVVGECDPATGLCSNPFKADGTSCNDDSACTQIDSCLAGVCVGVDPVICTALDQCHMVGECDPATGLCPDPEAEDGTPCDDGDGCTQTDSCVAGVCVGADPVICTALDGCHEAGECDPATGLCSNPEKPDGMPVSFQAQADTYTDKDEPTSNFGESTELLLDGRPDRFVYLRFDVTGIGGLPIQSAVVRMQTTSATNAGSDHGGNMYAVSDVSWDELTITDQNRPEIDDSLLSSAGPIEPSQTVEFDVTPAIVGEGTYSFGIKPGSSNMAIFHSRESGTGQPELIVYVATPCDDGDSCTQIDTCVAGSCVGLDPVICTALDQCHVVGECDPATGACSDPAEADGVPCDDGDACTQSDSCVAGVCVGADPVICTALDQCHVVGECDPATGACSEPAKADGAPCDDGDACTRDDDCVTGVCVGEDPVACSALDQCHVVGECDPATGACSEPAKADGAPCDDGNACTHIDGCHAGVCVGADPVVCAAFDQCHEAGECDPATGQCSNPVKADGSPCDDGDGCTQTDACFASVCIGAQPVACIAEDQCHEAGECDPATGQCSSPAKADGTPCDDSDLCTQADSCQGGRCSGANTVLCPVSDQCHDASICDPATGQCSNPVKTDGWQCDDGNPCTRTDRCIAGTCTGADPVICTALDGCHEAGKCDPATGRCSNPVKADGAPCDDGDACSGGDICSAGECIGGEPMLDSDGDGFCDAIDSCAQIPDPAQLDSDGDGIGDLCQCTAPAPGRCIGGGGSARTDCLLEFTTTGPVTLNSRGTKVKQVLSCSDGDLACDLDGARDGRCTFGVALCFGNADPRYPGCDPATIQSMEVIRPSAGKRASISSQTNAYQIEQALGALGLEVRRRGRKITDSVSALGDNRCSPLVRLVAPAPKVSGGKAIRQKFQLRAQATNMRRDTDSFVLVCE